MKRTIQIFYLSILAIFSLQASANGGLKEMNISPPFAQLEQRMQLSDEFIASLRPFANGLDRRLRNLIQSASDFSYFEAENFLIRGMNNILKAQTHRFNESLAMEILERATLIHQVLLEESDPNSFSDSQMRLRLLTRAIDNILQKYLGQDLSYLNNFDDIDYFKFGLEYFEYLNNINKSIFNASAQYRIEKLCLEFLRYDFARDLNYQAYATQIIDISDSIVGYPQDHHNDKQSIQSIRSLRRLRNNVLESLKDNVNYNGKYVLYKGNLLRGDAMDTIYVGVVNSFFDGQLDISWKRRNGHALSRDLKQGHSLDEVAFENMQNSRFIPGQIVSKLEFNPNGTRFTRSGRLVHLFANGTAEVNWTHATGFGLSNAQSQTVHDSNTYHVYLPISELN